MRAGALVLAAALVWGLAPSPTRFAVARAALAPRACGDFLAELGRKPAHLVYAGCRRLADKQGKPLRALYRVAGRFAAQTEAELVKSAGLNPLRRSCCLWDAPAGSFKDPGGREYEITMTSGETTVGRREDWSKIPAFEVDVETLTEEI